MSKKQFIALAQALAASSPAIPLGAYMELISSIADVCAAQSSTFNRQRFIDACLEEID